jgi:hypothetical protein
MYKSQMKQQQQWMNRFNKSGADRDDDEKQVLLNVDDHDDENEDEERVTFPPHFARPPRAHFSHELGSNVLRMDHFCVWFNNVVGFYNYKFFLLTLMYLWSSCILSLVIIIYRCFISPLDTHFNHPFLRVLALILTVVVCIFFTAFSSMNLYMHLWQLSKNLTSIEYHKFIQLKAMANHFEIPFPDTHEYDDGPFENCKKMLGNDVWLWWLPISGSLPEDGYRFHINVENRDKIQFVTQTIQTKRENMWKTAKLRNGCE